MKLGDWLKDLEDLANKANVEEKPRKKRTRSKTIKHVSDVQITSLGRSAAPKKLGVRLTYSDEENRKIVREKMSKFAPDHVLTQVRALKCYWWRSRDRADSLCEYAEEIAMIEMEQYYERSEDARHAQAEEGAA